MKFEKNERQPVELLEISREIEIAAPIELAFEAVMEQLGPEGEMPGRKPFPMTIEAWPGGRWFRDLGNNSGNLWGHVQVIKPPSLIEICGPMMMSYPAVNHLQYRLKVEGGMTRLAFRHRGFGMIEAEHRDGLSEGWQYWLERIRGLAERKGKERPR